MPHSSGQTSAIAHDAREGLHWATLLFLGLSLATLPVAARFDFIAPWISFASTALVFAHAAFNWRVAAAGKNFRYIAVWGIATIGGYLFFLRDNQVNFLPAAVQSFFQTILAVAVIGLASDTPLLRRSITLLAIFFFVSYASCFTAEVPAISFKSFASGGAGLQFNIFLLTAVTILKIKSPRPLLRLYAGIGAAWILAAVVVAVAFILSDNETRARMQNTGLVRDFVAFRNDNHFRLQFPFLHHNTLALYTLLAGFSALAASRFEESVLARIAWKNAFALALATLILTTTRGAWAAAAAALAVYYAASPGIRKGLRTLIIAVAVIVLMLVAFKPIQERMRTTIDPETYQQNRSTFVLRTHAYQAAWEMGIDDPLTGIGHGPEMFQHVYSRDYMRRFRGDREVKQHAHNDALEYFAEGGVPSALLFISWMVFMVAHCWRKRSDHPWTPAALAILAAIIVYGLTNVTLSFTYGALAWMLLALVAAVDFTSNEASD